MNLPTYYTKTLNRGLITIPSPIRDKLSLNKGTLLKVSVNDSQIILEPLRVEAKAPYRTYSANEINDFLSEDKT